MSLISSISQVTYLHNQHCIKSLLSKQKIVKKSNKKGEIKRYGYKAIAGTSFSLFKLIKHLVRLCIREITFFKAFILLPNLNKCTRYAKKQ